MTQPVTTWTLPVTPEARAALAERGVTVVPETITLILKEATMRELRPFDEVMKLAKTDPFAGAAYVIQKRAEQPVSEELAREVVQDLTPPELAELLWAFKEGRRDTEGKLVGAVRSTLSGISDQLLSALGSAVSLSPPTSTDSKKPGLTS